LLQNKVPEVLPRLGGGGGDTPVHSALVAGLILAGYAAAFIGVALVLYRRRDIGSSQ
jgi:hypothetical protein